MTIERPPHGSGLAAVAPDHGERGETMMSTIDSPRARSAAPPARAAEAKR
jgi:hypothetical protein